MDSTSEVRRGQDGQLWLIALVMALCLQLLCLLVLGWMMRVVGPSLRVMDEAASAEEAVTTVYLEPMTVDEVTSEQGQEKKRFSRTSPDQEAMPEQATNRIGERNTRATSDRAADPSAPPLPSQQGVEPRENQDIETTQSDYQDGELDESQTNAAPSSPPSPAQLRPTQAVAERKAAVDPGGSDIEQRLLPHERLLEGPHPVDVPVAKKEGDDQKFKLPPSESPPADAMPANAKPDVSSADAVKPSSPEQPAFRGFQRKTAVVGSISRTGRSALDVEDSDLGRYQAQISRAVELEWQRNCVRHRDFITPGFLTVRFFVETSGRVKSVQFVGDMETGEVQKGFTLNSIRDAYIPPMPAELRQNYEGEPLELLFRFYF